MKKTSLVVVYCYLHHRAASSIAPRDRDRTLMTTTKMRTYADVMREFLIEGTVKLIRDVSENGRLAIGIVVYHVGIDDAMFTQFTTACRAALVLVFVCAGLCSFFVLVRF